MLVQSTPTLSTMPQLLTTLLYLMHILASISEQLFAGFNFIAIGISYHVLKRTQNAPL